MSNFSFQLVVNCSQTQARAGVFSTPHGIVETPRFMPVGTLANVKTVTPAQLADTGAQMILSNTYHLHLQPGEKIVAGGGGLHKFMAWDGPMLTDSGGFQVFSLSEMRKITEEGVVFRSPHDGQMIKLTPEKSIEIQNILGADVIMAFDECPPYPATYQEVTAATDRTYRWLERCIMSHQRPDQALFPIVQGGIYLDLRTRAATDLAKLDMPGYAIGGVSVGEPPELMAQIVRTTAPLLPRNKPRYLMGVGTYREIKGGLRFGSKVDFNQIILQNFLESPRIKCLPIDEETAEYYSQIYAELRRKGKPIPTNDMWIAATALQHRLPLFTYDRDFIHIENLQQGKSLDEFTDFN